jgi:hypothetical protein
MQHSFHHGVDVASFGYNEPQHSFLADPSCLVEIQKLSEAVYQMLIEIAPVRLKKCGDAWWKLQEEDRRYGGVYLFQTQIRELKLLNRGRFCHEEYSPLSTLHQHPTSNKRSMIFDGFTYSSITTQVMT